MSTAAINFYKADLRAIQFTLYEHLRVQQLFEMEQFSHLTKEECDAIVEQCLRFVTEVTGPLNGLGDRTSCRLEKGVVSAPPGFKAAWKKLYELGIPSFSMPQEANGLGGPHAIGVVLQELQSGANTSFTMYPELTHGAADVIENFALPEDKERFLPPMMDGRFSGTMCLSEPHAGSDVGAAKTRATHIEGHVYKISGTKCWISAGDHDLAGNIIHLVLARIDGAPQGTKGLSLFIVPKIWVNDDGSLGEPNDVVTASIEHKLGIKASATAVLNFGENGGCRGILVGGTPHMGMRQMFRMMNGARIAVGVQGLSIASSAFLNALAYARERMQGSSVRHFKDPDAPRVAIIEHSDVRRMVMEMKAKVEGMRTLAIKLALHQDLATALGKTDEGLARFHEGQVDLLTPILKAYCSDQAFRIAEMAIQTYGGAGYVQDNPVEQYCRDAKIFSIYEGTNHIQSLDLVARKLNQHGGENFKNYLDEIKQFVAEHAQQPGIGTEVRALGTATAELERAAFSIMEFFMGGKIDQVTLVANSFLEAMAEVTLGYLLLDAARVAEARRGAEEEEADDAPREDVDFYTGKIMAAKFFINRILPGVHAKVATIVADDRSALDVPDAGFSTAY
ncbi:MAG: acyl-CoA dehydrogenase C-terminal domain-containing protein [Deltaproteobacteria bacterium]|nr:acyl-CoA dehydrogenase C-terminal domain-containing protein [Deltaproteobacteria bacterium]